MKDTQLTLIEKKLILMVGISLPLINLRIDLGLYTITLYMISVILLFIYTLFKTYRSRKILKIGIGKQEFFIFLFLCIYCFSLMYSINSNHGVLIFIKLLISSIFYFLIKYIIVNKNEYYKLIMKFAIASLSIYISYLAYHYLFIFKASYLGINTNFATRAGKNSLAFMVSILIPFILSYLLEKKAVSIKSIIMTILNVIVLISVFLIQSRGLYLTTIICFIMYYILESKKKKLFAKLVVILCITLLLLYFIVPDSILQASIQRFSGLTNLLSRNSDIGDLSDERALLLRKGIELFLTSPLIGVGAGSFMYYGSESLISHNDYMLVLAEQGILGFLSFTMLIITFIHLAYKNYRKNKTAINRSLLIAMCGTGFYLLLVNAYDNILFWSLLGFISGNGALRGKLNCKSSIE